MLGIYFLQHPTQIPNHIRVSLNACLPVSLDDHEGHNLHVVVA
jgi:hypothetical protein